MRCVCVVLGTCSELNTDHSSALLSSHSLLAVPVTVYYFCGHRITEDSGLGVKADQC